MKLPTPVVKGSFLKRYKRFFADIELDGEVVTAHVPNTGSLKSCLEPDSLCCSTFVDNPNRKLKYTLQLIKTPSSWVGVNTGLANDLVWEVIQKKSHNAWAKYDCARREVKIHAKTRFDMALWSSNSGIDPEKKVPLTAFKKHKFHFIEVKNVTMAEEGLAKFPDAVTTRGQKHLQELMNLVDQGHKCELVFVVQRTDCKEFAPADEIDPKYGELLRAAIKKGVIVSPYACKITPRSIELNVAQPLKLVL